MPMASSLEFTREGRRKRRDAIVKVLHENMNWLQQLQRYSSYFAYRYSIGQTRRVLPLASRRGRSRLH